MNASRDAGGPGSIVPTNRRTFNSYPFWSPRFWGGMRLWHWVKLLSRNGFRIHPSRIPWALMTSVTTPYNSVMYGLQELLCGRRIRATQPVGPPIFILGHWRTGTTLLQELLWHDARLACPSNYQVFSTNHFLLTESFVQRYMRFLLPSKRPMDNVTMKWESPQEDEWARITMGLPSPYLRCAFSNQPSPYTDYLDMEGLSDAEVEAWKQGFRKFYQCVTLRTRRQIVFKSPHHTGRLKLLHQMYPDAKFIHVTRHPFTFFPSTLRMYRSFDHTQSLQKPHENDGLESYVLDCGKRMYRSFLAYRPQVPTEQIVDVRYDELTRDAIGTLRQIYDRLSLGDIEPAVESFQKYLAPRKSYVTNRHELPEYWQDQIRKEWSEYFDSFGYTDDDRE